MAGKEATSVRTISVHERAQFTVLLIDDEPELLEIIGLALQDAGYHCICTTSANDGLIILNQNLDIDIILTDLNMPVVDGVRLLELIRERCSDRSWLQILFLTAHATTEAAISALKLKAVDFMRKPIGKGELVKAIDLAAFNAQNERQRLEFWKAGQQHFDELSETALRVSKMLDAIKMDGYVHASSIVEENTVRPDVSRKKPLSRARILRLLDLRRLRNKHFSEKLFSDPALSILLDLMENHIKQAQISVSSLCETAGASYSTALRRLEDMERLNLLERSDDPLDGRRQFARLTPLGVQRITEFLTELDAKIGSSFQPK